MIFKRIWDFVYGERKRSTLWNFLPQEICVKSVAGEPAWRFIEKAGLKGIAIGGAMVSVQTYHRTHIVNTGGATAQDVKLLIDKIKKEVLRKQVLPMKKRWSFGGFNG